MKKQLQTLGLSYDWDRELMTCRPEYYQWQQWLFLKMNEMGLVYKKESYVNWDPVDQTVLANEQVIDGRGWRSGAVVEKKLIPQWFVRITDFADELLDDIKDLNWPNQVKVMQENWIGRSFGSEVNFTIDGYQDITVYTTRVDTLMGVSAVMIASEHPIAKDLAMGSNEIASFIQECQQSSTDEATIETADKKGIKTGLKVVHPVSGDQVDLWIANYVLMEYGSGAVMCVPAHDERDYEFAQNNGIK